MLVLIPAINSAATRLHDPGPRVEQTPSLLACAASVARRRPTARSADALSNRASTSFVHVKPRTHSSAAATSRP